MNLVLLDTIRHSVNSLVDISSLCNHAENISYSESYIFPIQRAIYEVILVCIDQVLTCVSTKYSHVYRSNAHNCIDQLLTCILIKYLHPNQVALFQCSNQVLTSVAIKYSPLSIKYSCISLKKLSSVSIKYSHVYQ